MSDRVRAASSTTSRTTSAGRRARRGGARRVPAPRGGAALDCRDHVHRRGRHGPGRHRSAAGRRAGHGEPREPARGPRGASRAAAGLRAGFSPTEQRADALRRPPPARTAASCGCPSRRRGCGQVELGYLWTSARAIVGVCLLLFLIGAGASRRFSEPIARADRARPRDRGRGHRARPAAGGRRGGPAARRGAPADEELARAGGRARGGGAAADRDGLRAAARRPRRRGREAARSRVRTRASRR